MRGRLILVGPRGSGKSSAGELAARRLDLLWVDTDRVVEQRAGCSTAAFFARGEEATFRQLERQTMLELLVQDPSRASAVVATGGGCVLDREVHRRLRQHPGVLWLTAPVEVLKRRITGSDRPSLTGEEPTRELERVVAQREPLYRTCASAPPVETGALCVDEVADVIQHFWHTLLHHDLR
jgi:shikimate kinase